MRQSKKIGSREEMERGNEEFAVRSRDRTGVRMVRVERREVESGEQKVGKRKRSREWALGSRQRGGRKVGIREE